MDDLNWMLQNLLERVPRTQCAVVLTVDGLKKYWAGLSVDEADGLAAIASTLCSTANQVGMQLSGKRSLRQVVVENEDRVFFVTSASKHSVLAVGAESTVEISVLSLEISRLCKQVAGHFAAAERTAAAGTSIGLR
jgi:predicted regulator of Ras-like GTPase activity (Roadblock/LC7/MglB family)